jgi:DNA-3-methyladenine glycosylase II
MQIDVILHPVPPYDFNLSFGYLGPNCPDPIAHYDGETFQRVWPLSARKYALASLRSMGTTEKPEVLLRLEAPKLRDEDVEYCLAQLQSRLCLDLALEPFYDSVKRDPVLPDLCRRNRGLKPVLKPTLFEALTWAILGQQINLIFACQVKLGMLQRFSKPWIVDGTTLFQYPEPSDLAGLDPAQWVDFKCSQRKAEYIIGLADLIQDGFNLEELEKLSDDEIIDRLVKIRGIGRWTAEYVLIQGFRRWDALPVGDAGLLNGVKRAYGLTAKPTEEELLQRAERWRPYRGLATYYLWWGKS